MSFSADYLTLLRTPLISKVEQANKVFLMENTVILISCSNLQSAVKLKPHGRHQWVFGMGTSGFMLMPMTPPTQCVAECAKCGFSK